MGNPPSGAPLDPEKLPSTLRDFGVGRVWRKSDTPLLHLRPAVTRYFLSVTPPSYAALFGMVWMTSISIAVITSARCGRLFDKAGSICWSMSTDQWLEN